ncbi:MAG: RIP metalloprotease RseP [Spirochaetales bacterium]|nr:RIP metalloprotease RseP [Spirochaetales bacterium]
MGVFTWSGLLSILIGFLGISIMILVHEFGHMLAARAAGINVEVLSFGFGPAVFKFEGKRTKYVIRAIPFGGSCKMSGGDDIQNAISQHKKHIDSYEEGSIWSVGPLKRIFAYAAGPIANILFAFLCYAILMTFPTSVSTYPPKVVLSTDYPLLYNVQSSAASEAGMVTGDTILSIEGREVSNYTDIQTILAEYKESESVSIETERGTFILHPKDGLFGFLPFQEAVVGHVDPDTPEKRAGLKANDVITEINGKKVTNMMDLLEASYSSDQITMTVQRGGKTEELFFENPGTSLNFTLRQQTVSIPGMNFFKALWISGRTCFSNFRQSIVSLFNVIRGKSNAGETLGGTFAASQSIGMLTTSGFAHGFNSGIRIVLFLLASVSISLAVANLLPIPALDGGLILVSLAELVTGRTFHPRVYITLQVVGTIMIFAAIAALSFIK